MSLIIHAPNIHQGGGKALLLALLGSLKNDTIRQVTLDARLRLDQSLPRDVLVERVPPTIAGRLAAEWRLRRAAQADDIVLCFGNLPPLFPLRARVVVYIQNRYQVDRRGLGHFPVVARYRMWFEHRWFDYGRRWVDEFVVQTPSMQRALEQRFGIRASVMPFVGDAGRYARRIAGIARAQGKKYDFVYVATGEPHKNHAMLVEAWRILSEEGFRPTLCLTLGSGTAPELCRWIEGQKRKYGLQIDITGVAGEGDLTGLYQASAALIYPSTFESFGLPLIEARQAGLPIVAAELDYVRDLVDPEESFDPHSAFSIAHAVKRFTGRANDELRIADAATFLHRLMDRT
jgi:glycosyltransferase involved in cell wall biosynthesis